MVETIVEATWQVLAKEGYEAANTNRIAERAGISVGSLYQYFPNKNAIVAAVQRRHHAEVASAMATAFAETAGQPLEIGIRGLVHANMQAHLADPDLHRALTAIVPAAVNPETLGCIRDGIHAQLRAWLSRYRQQLIVKDLDTAAFVVQHLVEAVVHATVDGPGPTPEPKQVEDEVAAMILRYLTG
ncbi:MAG: TetR/AcrR family transcriptional regulator [Pseudomonadota bacterium]